VAPGSTGFFRLLSPREIAAEGFENFPDFAAARSLRAPLNFQGEPVAKIRSGFVCLSDPERAQVCVATFDVFPAAEAQQRLPQPRLARAKV